MITLVGTIALYFLAEVIFFRPDFAGILREYLPTSEIVKNSEMLYLAIAILGATVMPHNLYLHSSIVQTRNWKPTLEKTREAIKFSTLDSTIALWFALLASGQGSTLTAIVVRAGAGALLHDQCQATSAQPASPRPILSAAKLPAYVAADSLPKSRAKSPLTPQRRALLPESETETDAAI